MQLHKLKAKRLKKLENAPTQTIVDRYSQLQKPLVHLLDVCYAT